MRSEDLEGAHRRDGPHQRQPPLGFLLFSRFRYRRLAPSSTCGVAPGHHHGFQDLQGWSGRPYPLSVPRWFEVWWGGCAQISSL